MTQIITDTKPFIGLGIFIPLFTSGNLEFASGESGEFIEIKPPAGGAVRFVGLTSGAASETNISVAVAGVDSVTSGLLGGSDSNASGSFQISNGGNSTFGSGEITASMPPIQGDKGQAITVTKTSGSTLGTINYSYQTGIFI